MAVGIGALYFVTTSVSKIQEEDDKYQNVEYQEKHQFDHYYTQNSIGQEILDLTEADAVTQVGAWNKSPLKEDFLSLFPDFDEMKIFVKERTRGAIIQEKLTELVKTTEMKFVSGELDTEQAKRKLSKLR
jgi:hypothetical protein